MIKRSNMLIIGSAGRNVGKTEFACQLIAKHATQGVLGVKITTIKERGGNCPRGCDGCGVCSSLKGDFEITEETSTDKNKDTSRMLQAGAAKVLWLRVLKEKLKTGVAALLDQISPNTPIVCEANSAREALRPGLFLVVRDAASTSVKSSCQAVIQFADRLVLFNGSGWDFSPERVHFLQNHWLIRHEAAAIILAGGRSGRMGCDKSLMGYRGLPLIQHVVNQLRPMCDQLLISANEPSKYAFLELPVIPDETPGQGPLAGIASSLKHSPSELNLITGCDIPTVDPNFINSLFNAIIGHDLAMPHTPEGNFEPLLAVYRKSVWKSAERLLKQNIRRPVVLLDHLNAELVDLPTSDWYHNINTREDYQRALETA